MRPRELSAATVLQAIANRSQRDGANINKR